MIKLEERKSYLSPPGSQPSSQSPSQHSSDSSHSDHAHYSIVEDYSTERPRPEHFVPPRHPPAVTMLDQPKQSVSPASTMISAPPPRSSSHPRLDQLPGQPSPAQPGMQTTAPAGRQPIKDPKLRINTARAQRSVSPTYQAPRPTSPLGPGRPPLTASTSSSSLHAFSPMSPMTSYPPISPSAPVHAAHMGPPPPIAHPVRAVAPSARVNPMIGASPPAAPPAPTFARAPSSGEVSDNAGHSGPVAPVAPVAPEAVGLAVSGPAIPVMLAQAPARSTSLESRSAVPGTPISPMIQTPSGAMQFPFSALSPPTSPKRTHSLLSPEGHEMQEYFDPRSVEQIIRDVPQVQNVTAQYAPDVQGLTASVHGYISPIPSPSPERPERSTYLTSSPERLPYLSPEHSGNPPREPQQ